MLSLKDQMMFRLFVLLSFSLGCLYFTSQQGEAKLSSALTRKGPPAQNDRNHSSSSPPLKREGSKKSSPKASKGFGGKKALKGEGSKTVGSAKIGSGTGESVTIETTHLIRLKNGRTIRARLVRKKGDEVEFELPPYGTFKLAASEIDSLKEEPGKIVLERPRPKKGSPPEEKKRHEGGGKSEITKRKTPIKDLRPPPLPPEKEKEILRWLYHLTSSNPKWRVRAERHLKTMGPVVIGPLLPYTKYPRWLVRAASFRILGSTGHPAAVPALFEGLVDPVPMVREAALKAIKEVTRCPLGFDPLASIATRKKLLKSWESWLLKKGYLPANDP